jgi:oligoendopeptidase F
MQIKKPANEQDLVSWEWADFEPGYSELIKQNITSSNVEEWLGDWSLLCELGDELTSRLYVATSVNTADKAAEKRFEHFMEKTYPGISEADQKLKEKLLASSLQPAGFEEPLRKMRGEADIFRMENIPLQVEEQKISTEHDKVMGAQTVTWKGEEKTVRFMETVLLDPDRAVRQQGWELLSSRQLADRETINQQWKQFMDLRLKMAKNAGKADYRSFRWQQLSRFAYSPEDCKNFHLAIEEAVVPVVTRLAERRKQRLGIKTLRYYDISVDPFNLPPLKPFEDARELIDKVSSIYHQVLPLFGDYFDSLDKAGLLDVPNRKNKASGAYCTSYSFIHSPFIFANAVGIPDDVQTLLHEGGHSFHDFETFALPFFQQRHAPMEFAEVASMGMELLATPYLAKDKGGFYSERDSARALIDHLETGIQFWPYMAIVDAFQHWVYENPEKSIDPVNCDACWASLEKRFRPHLDWSGYEDVMMTGWQRKDHIHSSPFYYVEYGLALLGAAQIWRNSLSDQAGAVQNYRKALQLGCTVPLPELFKTAGAKLAFDASTLGKAVGLMEKKIAELETKI